jgi:hypothetical protein
MFSMTFAAQTEFKRKETASVFNNNEPGRSMDRFLPKRTHQR